MISVIIPTVGEEVLSDTIQSVPNGGVFEVEIIVVDGTTDQSAKMIAKEAGAKYIHQGTEGGAHEAREIGAKESKGEYIQFLDADDKIIDGKFSKQMEILESDSQVGVVYCGFYRDGREVLPSLDARGDVLAEALSISGLATCSTSTMLIERSLVEDLLPFPNKHGADDTGMIIELANRTQFDFIEEPLIKRGPPGRETSFTNVEGREQIFEMYSELYDDHPDEIRYKAMATYYLSKGARHIESSWWSLKAIQSFQQYFWYSYKANDSLVLPTIIFCTSLTGRLSWEVGKNVRKKLI